MIPMTSAEAYRKQLLRKLKAEIRRIKAEKIKSDKDALKVAEDYGVNVGLSIAMELTKSQ